MPRLDRLPPANRSNRLTFPAPVNDTAPFSALSKPLDAARLAFVIAAESRARW